MSIGYDSMRCPDDISHNDGSTTYTRTHNAGNQLLSEKCGTDTESFLDDGNGNPPER